MKSIDKVKVIISIGDIFCYIFSLKFYRIFEDSFLSSLATNQVNDSIISYSLIRQLIETNILLILITILFLLPILFMWIPNILKLLRKEKINEKN